MFKSIFSKYFAVVALVVLTSFVALCGTQTLLSARYWTNERRESLCQSAVTVAEGTASFTSRDGKGGFVIGQGFQPFFKMLSDSDANFGRVIVVNAGGEAVLSTVDLPPDSALPPSLMQEAIANVTPHEPWFFVGTVGGVYAERQYTAVAPVMFENEIIAYVFVSSPTDRLVDYIVTNLQVFLLSATTVLALTFAVMYVMTFRLVKPLRQMAEVTRRFAEGDFSARVTVKGRDEVTELAAALNSMAVSIASAEESRRSFVGNISHELKTPMTTIAGFIDGILDGTIPAEQRDHYLHIVSDEVKRLSRLVKSMLDLSRIDSGHLTLKPVPFDLTETACKTLLSFEQRLSEKGVTVEGLEDAPRCFVRADFDLIGQVVYNLTDNATKFVNEGGTLTLEITPRDGWVYLRIRNTGAGIPAPEMPHIFERFYKSDRSRSLDKQGVGLGLYIVKNVISLHGGEITVRSVEHEFCEFEFRLPGAEEPRALSENV